jgi:hypothetical protein
MCGQMVILRLTEMKPCSMSLHWVTVRLLSTTLPTVWASHGWSTIALTYLISFALNATVARAL